MKKNDWILLATVLVYSYLFYEQAAGINFLLFTLLLLGITVWQTDKEILTSRSWQIVAGASLLSSLNVVFVNSGLAVLANIISLILLSGFSRLPQTSIFVAAVNSLFSLGTSFVNATFKMGSFISENESGRTLAFAGINRQQVSVIGIPVLVCLTFLGIYCSASASFTYLLSQIDLSFISWYWIFFTLSGFWLLFGFFRQQIIRSITKADITTGNQLFRLRKQYGNNAKNLGLKYEYKTGIFMLLLLNLLLLAFNLSDAFYLTIGKLPAEVPYSEYLHQGVNALIFSMVLAIAILLYLFRGNLNFFAQNKTLKMLAYLWLAQNLILVFLTLTKNAIYVQDYGLTYKRIGVYTYLTLTAIGLITSYFKIAKIKNNWYLFRKNSWAVYFVLLLLSCFNWDQMLTNFNLYYAKSPDLNYLTTLSDANLPQLLENSLQKSSPLNTALKQAVLTRSKYVLQRVETQDWQTWSYTDWQIKNKLTPLLTQK